MRSARLAIALAALGLAACAAVPGPAEAPPAPQARASGGLEDELGVRLERLQLSAAGYFLDMRYRVLDVDKARALFERRVRPVLLDGTSGLRVTVPDTPKLGQLRSTAARNVKADRTYSMLFANPGKSIARGTRLTLLVGNARIDGLVVE